MKKVIRLTESDLVRIVKRVISEQDNDPNKGIALKVVGMLMVATGGMGTDEEKIMDALKLIANKDIYKSVIKVLQTSPKVKSQYGKNFNKIIDLIATDVESSKYADPYHAKDTEWFNKFGNFLSKFNWDEQIASGTGSAPDKEFDTN